MLKLINKIKNIWKDYLLDNNDYFGNYKNVSVWDFVKYYRIVKNDYKQGGDNIQ